MFTDEVSIFNAALNAVGTRARVSLPTETSREAEVCRLWFGPVRDQVLRAAPWQNAKTFKRLATLAQREANTVWDPSMPDPAYTFAYQVPSDMVAPRFLSNYTRFEMSTFGKDRLALMSNTPDAILCYTFRQEKIPLWDPSMAMAIMWGLAAYIAMPLQGKAARARNAIEEANNLLMTAREDSGNLEARVDTIPSWISARGYATPLEDLRFYYPLGGLFSAGEIGV